MLAIFDLDGNNLTTTPPEARLFPVAGGALAQVSIQAVIVEDDPLLPFAYVAGTLDWRDGSLSTALAAAPSTITVDETKSLGPGAYIVTLRAQNFASPSPQSVAVNFEVNVVKVDEPAPPPELIFGPILPRDEGLPNVHTWDLDRGSDILILESSVRMILITAKGERIMEPDYGTNLRRLLFESNSSAVESLIQQEIIGAVAKFEPRVKVQGVSVQRNQDRSASVFATFVSALSAQPAEIGVTFTR